MPSARPLRPLRSPGSRLLTLLPLLALLLVAALPGSAQAMAHDGFDPAKRAERIWMARLRTPKPCSLGSWPGVGDFIFSDEKDVYNLEVEFGYNEPCIRFEDINEEFLGAFCIPTSYGKDDILALLESAKIRR